MKLYLLRHGIAYEREQWHNNDFDRPLTPEGKTRMARQAIAIAKMDLALDAILTSPLVRAYQTAEIVAQELKQLDRLAQEARLGLDFNASELAKILRAHTNARALMLVGHEPGMSETISYLIGGGRVEMKKGALACIELNDPLHLHGTLVWLASPKCLVQ